MSVVRRGAVAIINTVVILAVVAVPPWALLHYAANPFPRAVDEIGHLAVEPLTLRQLAPFLTILLWAVWLLLLSSLAIEAIARTRGISPLRWRMLRPVQGLAAALIAGQAATLFAPAATCVASRVYVDQPADTLASAASPMARPQTAGPRLVAHDVVSEPAPLDTVITAAAGNLPAAQGPATVLVGEGSYTYIVERGDWMSKIAKAWLGDAGRWPEICELNRHRHFPKVGGTLRDCNIIYPGWDLRLPADARPPAYATPIQPPAPPPQVQDPDGVIGEPTPSPSTTLSPSAPASPQAAASPSVTAANPAVPTMPATPTPSPSASAAPSASPSADGSADASASVPATDEHGVRLPDGGHRRNRCLRGDGMVLECQLQDHFLVPDQASSLSDS